MEAPDVPLESAQEHINHHAEHATEGKEWILGVALSSAIFAALAAVTSLLAGHHVNEALIAQIDANNHNIAASDKWAEYQAKSIKATVLSGRLETFRAFDKAVAPQDEEKLKKYEREQEELSKQAHESEDEGRKVKEEGERHLHWHIILARAVTMFQVSIAVAAISVLARRRIFWFVSLLFGGIGAYFFIQQLLSGLASH